ncbi:Guanylate kinase-associated protein mars [Anthophora plagiata]
MSTFQQQYKQKTFGFGDIETSRFLRTKKYEERCKTQRVTAFNKNRNISNSAKNSPQNREEQVIPVVEDRMTRLLKWKNERERRRKLERVKTKPPFVVGVVHHKICSPITKDDSVALTTKCKKTSNQLAPVPSAPLQKRVTRATEKRLMNKAHMQKVTKSSFKNPGVVNKEQKCWKKDEVCFAPADHKFKAPAGLHQVPLFGRVVIETTPAKANELMTPSRTKRTSRKSEIGELNVKSVDVEENDAPSHEKNSDLDDSPIESISLKLSYDDDEVFNCSNTNSDKNDKIKCSDENVVHNSKEYTNKEHNNKEHSDKEHNEKVHNCTQEVLSSSKDNMSVSLKSNSPSEPVFFSPYIVCSRGKSNARKEQQLKRGFSLSHSLNDDIPTKDTVMKNLNISVEEEERTAKYFQFLLNTEITRLNELCKTWTEIKANPETTEDGQYQINQTIGQTNLLINKKFERFRRLVADCETGKGEMLVRCKDLQGFWDMMYIEVKNCDARFEKLKELRSRGWKEEELPIGKPVAKKQSIVKRNVVPKKSSSIRAFLAEKKRKMAQEVKNNGDMKEIEVKVDQTLANKYQKNLSPNVKYKTRKSMSSTPDVKDYTSIKRDKRLSLLQKVHLSETSKNIKSPLTIIKVSQMYKTPEVHLDDTISYVNSDQTPGRSILQSSNKASTVESRLRSTNKVNFDDHVIINEVPIDEATQTKMDLAAALSRIDSFNFDNSDEAIKAGRKLVFDDDRSEESEEDIGHYESKNSTVKDISNTPTVPVKSVTPAPRRSLRRQNAFSESDEILHETSPLKEIADDANIKKRLQKHVSISDKQEISENDESIRVLRNRTIAVLDTPMSKRKSLKGVSTDVQELEHKENKTPSERGKRKSSFKVTTNDNGKMDLHSSIGNMSLEESNVRRRSAKNVKFLGKEPGGFEVSKSTLPMTPYARRSRARYSDRKRSTVTEDLISWETPEKLPQRIRKSQSKKVVVQSPI